MSRRALAAVLTALALGVAACGEDDAPSTEESAGAAPSSAASKLEHIHGLGVDPRGTLFVATHYGLFRAANGSSKLEQVGDSTQDIMGFSVVAGDRFLGSGHPDPSEDLPPNLGLIESRDRGRTWRSISLLGKADFHVLRSAGERVYGFDGPSGQLMVSSDGGLQWRERTPPAAIFDLAVDPGDPDRIYAATERGLFVSPNAGKGWRPGPQLAGLLAWTAPDRLFLIDGEGAVLRSADGGRSFQPAGRADGQPVAFTGAEDELYVASADGTVKRSRDGGRTWAVRATP